MTNPAAINGERRPNALATKLGLFAPLSAEERDTLAKLPYERLR